MIRTRAAAVIISVTTVVGLAACSSSGSGGSGVTSAQLAAKLKMDSSISALTKSGGAKAAEVNKFVDCVSKSLIKDADPKTLKEYVEGKIGMDKVKPKSSDAKDDAKTAIVACEKSTLKTSG